MTTATRTRKRRKDAGVPKELTEAHKAKMKKAREQKRVAREKAAAKEEATTLRQTIKRLQGSLEKAQAHADKTHAKLRAAGGASKASEKVFNEWLKADQALFQVVTALKAHEDRLANGNK